MDNLDNFDNAVGRINTVEMIGLHLSRKRKKYNRRCDPFTSLDDDEFRKKYRLSKPVVRRLVELVSSDLGATNETRGGKISPELQVLACLRYWGRGEIQDDCSDLHGFSQPTMSVVAKRMATAIARKAGQFIKMPSGIQEQQAVIEGFQNKFNFPQVIGAIDGTHIPIKKISGESGQYYVNRKGYYSINTQVICDSNLKIRNIVARWRGSTHDARIFRESRIKERFENNEFRGRLLGDAGYACTSYLFTPLRNPQSRSERSYNRRHIHARNCVERCFGVLKQRWRCLLRGLFCSLETAKTTIVALAVLHNIAIEANDELLPDDAEIARNMTNENMDPDVTTTNVRGAVARRMFIESHF